jgi:hypothetical protein
MASLKVQTKLYVLKFHLHQWNLRPPLVGNFIVKPEVNSRIMNEFQVLILHLQHSAAFVCLIYEWNWCLHSKLWDCKANALPLEPHIQCILLWLFWNSVSQPISSGSNSDPMSVSQVSRILYEWQVACILLFFSISLSFAQPEYFKANLSYHTTLPINASRLSTLTSKLVSHQTKVTVIPSYLIPS